MKLKLFIPLALLCTAVFIINCSKVREKSKTATTGCAASECHISTVLKTVYPTTDQRHVIHVEKKGFDCKVCHNDYNNVSFHKNGVTDSSINNKLIIYFDKSINPNGSFDISTKSCQNLSCHGTIAWDEADTKTCTAICHYSGNNLGSPDPMTSTGHQAHVIDGGKPCSNCHYNYKETSTHANGTLDTGTISINFDPSVNPNAAYSAGLQGGTCSNTICHGTGNTGFNNNLTPEFNSNAAVNCTTNACHGGNNNDGNPADSTPNPDDKHRKHIAMLTNTAGYTLASDTCTACHNGLGMGQPNHANGQIDVSFNYTQGGSPGTVTGGSFDSSSGEYNDITCSDTYCHGNFSGGSYASITWSGTAQCGSCHPANGTNPVTVKHTQHLSRYPDQCGYCHKGYTTTFTPGASVGEHVDFTLFVSFGYTPPAGTINNPAGYNLSDKTCTNVYCHGNFPQVTLNGTPHINPGNNAAPTWLDSSTAPCGSCHGNTASNYSSVTHGKHTATNQTYFGSEKTIKSCDTCHNYGSDGSGTGWATLSQQGSYGTGNHANFVSDISFDTIAGDSGYLTSITSPGYYTLPRSANSQVSWNGTKCSDSWCHGNFEGTLMGSNASPEWLNSSTAACGTCHSTSTPVTNAHPKHLSAPYSYECSRCHSSYVGHINGTIIGTDNIIGFDSLNPNGSFNSATKQCGNLYCHGNTTGGDWSNFAFGTSTAQNNNPLWTASGSVTCGTCHNATGLTQTSGSHTKHIGNNNINYNYSCSRCHSGTVESDNTTLLTGHADGILAVTPDSGNPSGFYTSGSMTCMSFYCHGNFTGGLSGNVADWDAHSGGSCGNCHNLAPQNSNYGSHDKHTDSTGYGYDCSYCHNSVASGTESGGVTLDGNMNSTSHADFTRTIVFNNTADQGPGTAASYNSATNFCSKTYCHGDFRAADNTPWPEGNKTNEPNWTSGAGGAVCGTCHGTTTGNNAGLGIPNNATDWHASEESHIKHAGVSKASGYNYPCGFCHNGSYDGTLSTGNGLGGAYETGTKTPGYSLHANGLRDINFYTSFTGASSDSNPGASPEERSCNNLYCHSNGWGRSSSSADTGGISNPVWGGGSKSSIDCLSCHNSGGTPQPHNNASGRDHYNDTDHADYSCNHCHETATNSSGENYADTTIDYTSNRHVNTWVNVQFGADTTAVGGGLYYDYNSGKCYVRCHKSHNPRSSWYNSIFAPDSWLREENNGGNDREN